MKPGDLVRLCPDMQWLTADAASAVGLVFTVLDTGSLNAFGTYGVIWPKPIPPNIQSIGWHSGQVLRKVDENES